MDQALFQIIVAVAGAAVMFIAARIWSFLTSLQKRDEKITEQLNRLEVMMVGNYISKATFEHVIEKLEKKIDNLAAMERRK